MTTNLRNHLSRIRISPDSSPPAEKKATLQIDSCLKTTCSEGHAKKITNLMVEMIMLDLRPAATVEGIGFRQLINHLKPNYRVPSAVHITNCLQGHYVRTKTTRLIYMLQEPSHVVLRQTYGKCGNTVIHNSHCTFHFIKLGAQNKQPIFLKIIQQTISVKNYKRFYQIFM